MHKTTPKRFPSCITVFSAPNYLDCYNNKGAILRYGKGADGKFTLNIKQFVSVDHPYWLPNFMNVFAWSMPFVAEKITELLLSLLKNSEEEEVTDDADKTARERIKEKIRAFGKMSNMLKQIRTKRNIDVLAKGLGSKADLVDPKSPSTLKRELFAFL
eukprot:TRINITY_DN605_c0_g1_i2.p1 TRINITY_DN605_c0_g1~~TRINITY_DN605_c0_g1_i2.p1  ORF type:complete len:158 (+),score=12.95 TRINITY_DN605_c0_g1_i2:50-523(+)